MRKQKWKILNDCWMHQDKDPKIYHIINKTTILLLIFTFYIIDIAI